jgi:hypothetical protein
MAYVAPLLLVGVGLVALLATCHAIFIEGAVGLSVASHCAVLQKDCRDIECP